MKRDVMSCPFNGTQCIEGIRKDFKKGDIGERSLCRMWTLVRGKDPQSNKEIDQGDCAIAWMPTLIIENAQMARHTTASVDKFFNGIVRALPPDAQRRVVGNNNPNPRIGPNGKN